MGVKRTRSVVFLLHSALQKTEYEECEVERPSLGKRKGLPKQTETSLPFHTRRPVAPPKCFRVLVYTSRSVYELNGSSRVDGPPLSERRLGLFVWIPRHYSRTPGSSTESGVL